MWVKTFTVYGAMSLDLWATYRTILKEEYRVIETTAAFTKMQQESFRCTKVDTLFYLSKFPAWESTLGGCRDFLALPLAITIQRLGWARLLRVAQKLATVDFFVEEATGRTAQHADFHVKSLGGYFWWKETGTAMHLFESHHLSSNGYRCIPSKKLLQLRDECIIMQYQYFGLLKQRYGWLFLASLCGCHARVSDGSSDHVLQI